MTMTVCFYMKREWRSVEAAIRKQQGQLFSRFFTWVQRLACPVEVRLRLKSRFNFQLTAGIAAYYTA